MNADNDSFGRHILSPRPEYKAPHPLSLAQRIIISWYCELHLPLCCQFLPLAGSALDRDSLGTNFILNFKLTSLV